VTSTVLPGSGLSSSAAFEVLIGTILNELFFDKQLTPVEIAQIGQWAENVYFGKPCGLMDQTASSVGGMVFIDFNDPKHPIVERLDFDFAAADGPAAHEKFSAACRSQQNVSCIWVAAVTFFVNNKFILQTGLVSLREGITDSYVIWLKSLHAAQ
jgi:mevalonate kinase